MILSFDELKIWTRLLLGWTNSSNEGSLLILFLAEAQRRRGSLTCKSFIAKVFRKQSFFNEYHSFRFINFQHRLTD